MTRHAACLIFNDDDVNHLGDLTNRLARSHPDGEPARDSPMMVFWVWVRLVTVTDQRFLGTRRATSLPRVPPAPPRRFDPYPSPASRVDVAMVPPDVTDIELMRDEAGGLLYEAGIATVTFFRGDIVAASRALRAQFDAVARLNPWPSGRAGGPGTTGTFPGPITSPGGSRPSRSDCCGATSTTSKQTDSRACWCWCSLCFLSC